MIHLTVDPSGSYFSWKASAMGKKELFQTIPSVSVNDLEKPTMYTEDMELDDAVHTAILTLKEGFEGQMSGKNIEIGIIGANKKFRYMCLCKSTMGMLFKDMITKPMPGIGLAEAKVGVNKPQLLPKAYSTVIDVAGFLSDGQLRNTLNELEECRHNLKACLEENAKLSREMDSLQSTQDCMRGPSLEAQAISPKMMEGKLEVEMAKRLIALKNQLSSKESRDLLPSKHADTENKSHQKECTEKDKNCPIDSQLNEKISTMMKLEEQLECAEDSIKKASNCATVAFVIVNRLLEVNLGCLDDLKKKDILLSELADINRSKDALLKDHSTSIEQADRKISPLQLRHNLSEEQYQFLHILVTYIRKRLKKQ